MRFVINGLKYDTENMEKVANVKKWYESRSQLIKAIDNNAKVGTIHDCELWKSKKGKLAFDTYGRLRNESRGSNNRRGSEKPFNEICTG